MRELLKKIKRDFLTVLFIFHDDLYFPEIVKLLRDDRIYVFPINQHLPINVLLGTMIGHNRKIIHINDINDQIKVGKCDIGLGINEQTSEIIILKYRRLDLYPIYGGDIIKLNNFKSHIKEIINNYKYDLFLRKYLNLDVEETMCERVADVLEKELIENEAKEMLEAKRYLNRYK